MSNLRFFVDAQAIADTFGELKKEVEEALTQGVQQVASMTYARTQELASNGLHSTRKTYMDALSFEEVSTGLWVVSLDEAALWIEEGRKAGSMVEDLLRKNAKVSKDGSRYKAIPFSHNKAPSETPKSAQLFVNQVKQELKNRNIPYSKLEYNTDGSPRIGKLHTIKNIWSFKPSARASHGALSGLTIYQRKGPGGKVKRDILTFRVVSSKHTDKWIHPGLEGQKFMDEALTWAEKVFDNEILPSIMDKFGKG